MSIGMGVNAGGHDEKITLARLLEDARTPAIAIGLYVNGQPFEILLAEVAQQLRAQVAREKRWGLKP